MVTNYATHLTVWNLLENKKIVSLSCRSELFSVLFSANDRFIGTTNINELCVYDTENRYSMVSRSFGAENFSVLVSTFSSDSWYLFDTLSMSDHNKKIVKYDLRVKPLRALFGGKFPRNAKAAAEIQAADKRNDVSWRNKVGYGYIFILRNESILVYKDGLKEIKLFRLTQEIQKLNKKKQAINLFKIFSFADFYSVSVNGRYFYTHELSNFHIL